MDLMLKPTNLTGTVPVPASKSVAHRAYICAALATSKTDITCDSDSVDIRATRNCLARLTDAEQVNNIDDIILDCKESGSTLRFLLPLACVYSHKSHRKIQFTGAEYLAKRPLSPLVEELCAHGANISSPGSFPLTISGELTPGVYTIPGNISSQYISGLLMALPLLSGDSELHVTGTRESVSYIGLTLAMQKQFRINIEETPYGYYIPGNQVYCSPGTLTVEADWSSAAFWLAAGAIGTTAPVLTGLSTDSLQGDLAVLDVLKQFGAVIRSGRDGITIQKPTALHGITVNASDIPDLVPVLAVVAAHAEGKTTFTHASRLRLKESDRIATTEELLQRLGIKTASDENTLTVYGTGSLSGSSVQTPIPVSSHNDHRIAMSAAVAATVSSAPLLLTQAESVSKSYPTFFEHYKNLGGQAEACTPERS